MSSREPLWFCHQCHAEMRPLMAPDPVCASCHGSFVEKLENLEDDPRNFAHGDHDFEPGLNGLPHGVDTFFLGLQNLVDREMRQNTPPTQRSAPSFTVHINDNHGTRTIRLGAGANPTGHGFEDERGPPLNNPVPNMSTFTHAGPLNDHERPTIAGALMAQYLMAMLGNQGAGGTMVGMPENGRMGDYVFNQEALDQIMTQIMENSNAHNPVPATEEIMKNLSREVLMEDSPTLQKDCAVCKEQFSLETEDPEEHVVVTLPCQHPFHEPCILPWLRSSGTCPVCRHALVPQPELHSTAPRPNPGQGGRDSSVNRRNSGPPNGSTDQPGPSGLFHPFFANFPGHSSNSNNNGNRGHGHDLRSSSRSPRSPPNRRNTSSRRNSDRDHLPGGWPEELD